MVPSVMSRGRGAWVSTMRGAHKKSARAACPWRWGQGQRPAPGTPIVVGPSAESSDLFWHNQMLFTRTFIVGIDPCFQFGGTQQPVRFRDGPLAMNPFRFNRVKPRTFARQVADDDAPARGTPLDLLIMVAYPVLHGPASVPG